MTVKSFKLKLIYIKRIAILLSEIQERNEFTP